MVTILPARRVPSCFGPDSVEKLARLGAPVNPMSTETHSFTGHSFLDLLQRLALGLAAISAIGHYGALARRYFGRYGVVGVMFH